MYGLTESLQDAQCAQSPIYKVSATAAPRSAGGLAGGTPWEEIGAFPTGLGAWNGQSIAHDDAASEDGVLRLFLSHLEGKLACQWCSGDETNSASWSNPSVTEVTTFSPVAGIYTPKPALIHVDGEWHAFYLLPTGNIFHRSSGDNGASWSSATSLYAGADGTGDLFALYLPAQELIVLQFSTLSDAIRPRGLAGNPDSGWEVWDAHDDDRGWMAAGMVNLGDGVVRHFFRANATAPVRSFFGTLDCTVASDGALVARSTEATLLHYVAGASPVGPDTHAVGSGFGSVWMTQQVGGATRSYLCGGAVLRNEAGASSLPVEAMPVHVQPLGVAPIERHTIAIDCGDRTLLVGLGKVYRSQHETTILSDGEVIAYRYRAGRDGAGRASITLRRDSPLSAVRPGYGLWLARTCSKGAESGTVSLGLEVTRVEVGTDGVEIEAVDALGMLASARALQPFHLGASLFTRKAAVELICARAGIGADVAMADASALDWYWRSGENGLSALERLLMLDAVRVRSRVQGSGSLPYLHVADSEEPEAYLYGEGGHPVIRFVEHFRRSDSVLAAVRGPAIPNSPLGGEDWALAASSQPLALSRRHVLLTREDRSIGWLAMADAASVLATRLSAGSTTLTAQANLALEVHDRIELNEATWRVDSIVEAWDRGRCVQHVEISRE